VRGLLQAEIALPDWALESTIGVRGCIRWSACAAQGKRARFVLVGVVLERLRKNIREREGVGVMNRGAKSR